MAKKTIANLAVVLSAENVKLKSKLEKSQKDVERFRKNATKSMRGFSSELKTIFAGISVAGFAFAAKSALDYADSIADASEKTAFSVKRLQELKFAAEQNGVAFSELESGLARFTKRLGLARAGAGAAFKTYDKLGINLRQTNEQVFKQVVATLGSMESETNRLALATRLFGDDAQRLAVVFKDGNEGLKEFADEAADLGLILEDDLVQGASDANDTLDKLTKIIGVQLTSALVEIAPLIVEVGNSLVSASKGIRSFFDRFDENDQAPIDELTRRLEGLGQAYTNVQDDLAEIEAKRSSGASFLDPLQLKLLNKELDKDEQELRERGQSILLAQDEILEEIGNRNLANVGKVPEAAAAAVDTSALFGGGGKTTKRRASVSKQIDRTRESIDKYIESLQKEADTLDLTNEELIEYELRKKGATQADIDRALAINEEIEAVKAIMAVEKENLELMAATIDETEELDNAWQDLGPTFASAFEDAIVEGAALSDILKGLEKDIIRIITRTAITEPLGNFLGESLKGTGSGFNLGGLFGFANGGDFTVGGSGGTDSQVVAFKATPGEEVSIRTPQQAAGGMVINNSFVLPADTVDYRKTGAQVAREASRMIGMARGAV